MENLGSPAHRLRGQLNALLQADNPLLPLLNFPDVNAALVNTFYLSGLETILEECKEELAALDQTIDICRATLEEMKKLSLPHVY